MFIASQGHEKWPDNIFPRHSRKREACSESMPKFSPIQFFVRNATYIAVMQFSKYCAVGWKKIIRDSRILVDKKASDFVLSWTFVQKMLLAGSGVGLLLKKRRGNAVPTPNIKDRFAYKNFSIGSSCFTLVLRCYTRDNLTFIHLCFSRRYT